MGTVTSEESNNLRKVQDEGMKQVHTINKRWEKNCKAAKKKKRTQKINSNSTKKNESTFLKRLQK